MKRKALFVALTFALLVGSITGCGRAVNEAVESNIVQEYVSEQMEELVEGDEEVSTPVKMNFQSSAIKKSVAKEVIVIESEEKVGEEQKPETAIKCGAVEKESAKTAEALDKTTEMKSVESKVTSPVSENKQTATQSATQSGDRTNPEPTHSKVDSNVVVTGTCPVNQEPVYEDWYVDGIVLKREVMPVGHDFVVTDTFVVSHCCFDATTYTTTYYTCSRCGKEFSYCVTSPFTAFDECNIVWSEYNPNCETAHTKIKSCTVHNGWDSDPIAVPASEHDKYVVKTERNECEGTVVEYYKCTKCLYWNDYKVVESWDGPGHIDLDNNSVCDNCSKPCSKGAHNCNEMEWKYGVLTEGDCNNSKVVGKICTFCGRGLTQNQELYLVSGCDGEYLGTEIRNGVEVRLYRCKKCGCDFYNDSPYYE